MLEKITPKKNMFFSIQGQSWGKFRGDYYLFYHALCLQDSRNIKGGFRSICVNRIQVDEDNLKYYMGEGTLEGVSQAQPLNPFNVQQAETAAATLGIKFETAGNPGNMVAVGTQDGQCVMVRGADFTKHPGKFEARLKGKGKIEVRLDHSEGVVIASVDFDHQEWASASAEIRQTVSGVHNLCFVFGKGEFKFDEWRFLE